MTQASPKPMPPPPNCLANCLPHTPHTYRAQQKTGYKEEKIKKDISKKEETKIVKKVKVKENKPIKKSKIVKKAKK